MHPATHLAAFTAIAFAAQVLAPPWLLAFSAALVGCACGARYRATMLRSLHRLKFIFLALAVVHLTDSRADSWSSAFVAYAEALLRLLLVIAALSVLVTSLPRERLLCGLYTLLRPLQSFGLAIDRACVRLLLTLEQITLARSKPWRQLLAEATGPSPTSEGTTQVLTMPSIAWRWRDVTAPTALLIALYLAL